MQKNNFLSKNRNDPTYNFQRPFVHSGNFSNHGSKSLARKITETL